ncbi:TRAP transporter substrate-binding protein [Pleionea mediterranea]|uniref:TRAP-type mannitol/chloroaromatic compound transport system substrate-binding protein n=1 Tax=Pleionea mediterranea TaxID=523701 RepID=A0A316FXY5_9GAMM|nr:TRAP transporter substrate-binding protein [Pleionea mediterranea]PWK52965.1 TRAP-type mannitol/chloroaromatic compound transport system substrate-binding protein [Pleionea mediterranea]
MKRRAFVGAVGIGAAAGLSGCSSEPKECATGQASSKVDVIEWTMITTWPKNFQGLGEGAEYLAQKINELSGGRMKVTVMGANDLVPALEVFDTVAAGTVQMGHGASYYWKGKLPVAPIFSAVPFGLNAQEMNGWLYKGGGLELWQELYQPLGLLPMPAGNTGVQMAGWFNKEINSLDDIQGLKMRIPGLGGEVFKRAGGTPELIPGAELFSALNRGRIDATEWVGPYNDLAFGLHKAAKYYYYPGWHEPGTTLEAIINLDAFNALPDDLQAIVKAACTLANSDMLAYFTEKNNQALESLVNEHNVQLKKLPEDVLARFEALSHDVVKELAATDAFAERVYQSYSNYKKQVYDWHKVSEQSFYSLR